MMIFGRWIKHVYVKGLEDTDDVYGDYDALTHTIRLDSSLKGERLEKIKLHERLHALFDRVGFREALGEEKGIDFEESLCVVISDFIVESYEISERVPTEIVLPRGNANE